jgi:hypothetical protein
VSVTVGRPGGGPPTPAVTVADEIELGIEYEVLEPGTRFRCSALFFTQGVCAFGTLEPTERTYPVAGTYRASVAIPAHLLAEGEYTVQVSLFASRGSKSRFAMVRDAVAFHVADPMDGFSARGDYAEPMAGVMRPKLEWEVSDAIG